MKLWSVGVDVSGRDAEQRKMYLYLAVSNARVFAPGALCGTKNGMYNVIFAEDKAETPSDLIETIWEYMAQHGAGDMRVHACEILKDADWPEIAEALGVDERELKVMAQMVYDTKHAPIAMKKHDGITLQVSVEGVEEAVKQMKVLEAQLHGLKYQAERVEAAIDRLQLKLENKIETLSRPDR